MGTAMTDVTAIVNLALLIFAVVSISSVAVFLGRISRTLDDISSKLGAGPAGTERPQ